MVSAGRGKVNGEEPRLVPSSFQGHLLQAVTTLCTMLRHIVFRLPNAHFKSIRLLFHEFLILSRGSSRIVKKNTGNTACKGRQEVYLGTDQPEKGAAKSCQGHDYIAH